MSATFTLDALGRFATRVRSSGGTDTYAYLGAGETVAEISNPSTGTIRSMLDLGGSRLATRAGTATATFTLFDALGSLIGLMDSTRTITEASRFDGYGESVDHHGTTESPWRFRGHLDVSPTGDALYDMGARFYAPSIGAFTQMDTVAGSAQDPLSMNRFLYAHGNPATLIDPDGHAACSAYADFCPVNGSTSQHTVQKTRQQQSYAKKGYNERRESVYERSRGTARLVNNRKVSVLPKRVVPSSAQKAAQNRARDADERTRFSTDPYDAALEAVRSHPSSPHSTAPGLVPGTFAVCIGAGTTVPTYATSGSACLAFDTQGTVAITTTSLPDGVGTGFDATLSLGLMASNASTTRDLAGQSKMIGASAGEVLSPGFELSTSSDRNGNPTATVQINGQIGGQVVGIPPVALPAEVHGGYTETTVYPLDPGAWFSSWLDSVLDSVDVPSPELSWK